MMTKFIMGLYVVSAVCALVALKYGTANGMPVSYTGGKLHFNLNVPIFLAMFLYGFSFITYMYLISKHDLGYIIPFVASLVYILLFTASYFLFKETFTVTKIIAICLIMVGGILINIK